MLTTMRREESSWHSIFPLEENKPRRMKNERNDLQRIFLSSCSRESMLAVRYSADPRLEFESGSPILLNAAPLRFRKSSPASRKARRIAGQSSKSLAKIFST